MLLKLPISFVDLIKVTRANRNVILGREVKGPVPRMSLNTIPKRLLPKNVGLLHLALLYVGLMSLLHMLLSPTALKLVVSLNKFRRQQKGEN